MSCTSFRATARAATFLLFVAAPLVAQSSRAKVPVTSTTPRALPPGGIPKRAAVTAPIAGTLAAFKQSFQVSLDSVHWSTSITTSIACTAGTNAACAARTPPITVYTRWTPINPPVDMAAAQQQHAVFTEPYKIIVHLSNANVCKPGKAHVQPAPGFPVSIVPSGTGGSFPITCRWTAYAVAPSATTAPGQSPSYWLNPSNTVTVVVNRRLLRRR